MDAGRNINIQGKSARVQVTGKGKGAKTVTGSEKFSGKEIKFIPGGIKLKVALKTKKETREAFSKAYISEVATMLADEFAPELGDGIDKAKLEAVIKNNTGLQLKGRELKSLTGDEIKKIFVETEAVLKPKDIGNFSALSGLVCDPQSLVSGEIHPADLGGMDIFVVADQLEMNKLAMEAQIRELPPAQQAIALSRLRDIKDMADYAVTLRDDKFKPKVIKELVAARMEIRASGISERLQVSLKAKGDVRNGTLVDSAGRDFDHLRGEGSVMEDLAVHMSQKGGDMGIIRDWASDQGINSWNAGPQAMKYVMVQARNVPESEYFFLEGADKAKACYEKVLAKVDDDPRVAGEKFEKTWTTWMAFNMELLEHVDFPGKNGESKTVEIFRAENRTVMFLNQLKPGDENCVIKRGPAESGSIMTSVNVLEGTENTVQNVPFHRITGTYLPERSPGSGKTFFISDNEKEFLFMSEGVPFNYLTSE